jgi:hypothetical protein
MDEREATGMPRRKLLSGAVLVGALSASAAAQTPAADTQPDPAVDRPAAGAVEPALFFGTLVDRYRTLSTYEDVVDLVETRTTADRPPLRVETRLSCRHEGDRLAVATPGSQVRSSVVDVPLESTPAMEVLVLRYNLWLAPHMALHFVDDPLKDLRLGVPEGFTPAETETVIVDERRLVRLELRSEDTPDAEGAEGTARFEFWVDPESMLIERVEGRQRLPDGADYRTTLEITPVDADGAL